jgi:hypothetical protein
MPLVDLLEKGPRYIPVLGWPITVLCGGNVTRGTLICAGPTTADTIEFDDLWTALDRMGEPHLRRIRKFMEDDAEPSASFNSSI